MIETKDLTKKYPSGETEIFALRGINLSIDRGEIVALVGPSGSGKTTLLNIIGTLDKPTSGEVFVNGKNVTALNDRKSTIYRRDHIGFVFQLHNLIPYLTAYENVELPLIAKGVPKQKRHERVMSLLNEVGLSDRAWHYPKMLSGGERQRVAIARALANEPYIILADEPTGSLDSVTGQEIVELMIDIVSNNNGTLIIATHDPIVENLCNRIIRIRDGQIQTN